MYHCMLQNVVYMKKVDVQKRKKKRGGGQHLKKKGKKREQHRVLSTSTCGETNKNIETLLFGNDEISINENSNIFNKVRAYIRQTKRF